ncbi:MAG: Cof-type HAD-IIB family hydrolase [Clostridia bacterium]|nr:Cof-type HAD-IIB family hydrolase [Clostridia bacterium]
MMKIVVCDFDETLYENGTIAQKDKDAIAAFTEAGNKFGVVSGRSYSSALDALRWAKFYPDFLICCSGGVISTAKGTLRAFHANGSVLPALFDLIKPYAPAFFFVTDGLYEYHADLSGYTRNEFSRMFSFTQCSAELKNEADAEKFCQDVRFLHGCRVTAYRSGKIVNIVPSEVNKLQGIAIYREHIGENYPVYTIGDSERDIPMLKTYHGFAVKSASDAVKRAAEKSFACVADALNYIGKQ